MPFADEAVLDSESANVNGMPWVDLPRRSVSPEDEVINYATLNKFIFSQMTEDPKGNLVVLEVSEISFQQVMQMK